MVGVRAFREAFMSAELTNAQAFADEGARRSRYQAFWAFYENSAYKEIHSWAQSYRSENGLYRYIRNVYNPAYRLGEFWKAHLWGGLLDPEAGDGEEDPSALPILTDNPALRRALAQLWRDSNWQVQKDIVALHGPVLGDAGIRIVDDPVRRKVYLRHLHPATITELTLDPFGNVKGYELEESWPDPQRPGEWIRYRETAERVGGEGVLYRTYRNDQPFAYDGRPAEWVEPYGFIPLVMIKHNDVGLDWGWSELHAARSKIHEIDDMASLLHDHIRKSVNTPWLFTGLLPGNAVSTMPAASPTLDNPQPGRETIPAMWTASSEASAQALVAGLSIADVGTALDRLRQEIEVDYPELRFEQLRLAGQVSGLALRIARQPAEVKVLQRRPVYDDALVRAQQMALAIGGFRGYQGYEGFDLGSYAAGALEHHIGKRPVFAVDPLDDLEEEHSFWEVATLAKNAGLPLAIYLKRRGWSSQDLAEVEQSPEVQAARRMQAMSLEAEAGEGSAPPEERDER